MHLTVTLPPSFKGGAISDVDIASRAAKDKLWLWPLSPCYTNGKPRQGFILGYGNTPEDQMPNAVRHLRQLLAS